MYIVSLEPGVLYGAQPGLQLAETVGRAGLELREIFSLMYSYIQQRAHRIAAMLGVSCKFHRVWLASEFGPHTVVHSS